MLGQLLPLGLLEAAQELVVRPVLHPGLARLVLFLDGLASLSLLGQRGVATAGSLAIVVLGGVASRRSRLALFVLVVVDKVL